MATILLWLLRALDRDHGPRRAKELVHMRWQMAWIPSLFFLGGCFSMPSCDFDLGCEYDDECNTDEVCGALGVCKAATLCDFGGCPDGTNCVTRPASPAGNPFESPAPGKKICQCPSYPNDFDLSSCIGYGGGGGYGTGATGGGGSGGGSGGSMPGCLTGTPTGDLVSVESQGGIESERAMMITSFDTKDGQATLEAFMFKGAISIDGKGFDSVGDTDVAIRYRYPSGETAVFEQMGSPMADVVTAVGRTGYDKHGAVAVGFSGALTITNQPSLDAGSGAGAAVLEIGQDGVLGVYPVYSDGSVAITGIADSAMTDRFIIAGTFTGKLTVGKSELVSSGGTDGFIAEIDTSQGGEAVWLQQIGGAGDLTVTGLTGGGTDSRLFVIGDFQGEADIGGALAQSDGRDGFVLAVDSTGEIAAGRVITGKDSQLPTAAAVDPTTGHLILAGARKSELMSQGTIDFGGGVSLNGSGLVDTFLAEYTPDLELGWTSLLPGPGADGEIAAQAMAIDCAGQITLVGQTTGGDTIFAEPAAGYGKYDAFVCKMKGDAILWSHLFGGPEDDTASSVTAIGWERVIVGGTYAGSATFVSKDLVSAGADDAFRVTLKP